MFGRLYRRFPEIPDQVGYRVGMTNHCVIPAEAGIFPEGVFIGDSRSESGMTRGGCGNDKA